MTYTEYIISYLLHHNPQLESLVGYGAYCLKNNDYKVLIVPSGFFSDANFGLIQSEPTLPLTQVEGVPLLFGSPQIEMHGEQMVVYADIIASSFYLMSRYEEMIFPDTHRVAHGRFKGKESLPYRGGFLNRPLGDEYGALLRQLMRHAGVEVDEPKQAYSSIVLTHVVDTISHYLRWRGTLGVVKRKVFVLN